MHTAAIDHPQAHCGSSTPAWAAARPPVSAAADNPTPRSGRRRASAETTRGAADVGSLGSTTKATASANAATTTRAPPNGTPARTCPGRAIMAKSANVVVATMAPAVSRRGGRAAATVLESSGISLCSQRWPATAHIGRGDAHGHRGPAAAASGRAGALLAAQGPPRFLAYWPNGVRTRSFECGLPLRPVA